MIGHGPFTVVAPGRDNFLVAQQFQDATKAGAVLDVSIDQVFTPRMRPSKVTLRLLASPESACRDVVVRRNPA